MTVQNEEKLPAPKPNELGAPIGSRLPLKIGRTKPQRQPVDAPDARDGKKEA